MASLSTFLSPSCSKAILQPTLSWQMEYQGLYFSIIVNRVWAVSIRKVWNSSEIFRTLTWMIFWGGRKLSSNNAFLRLILIFGSSSWNLMVCSVRRWVANMVLNIFHKNGFACLKTQKDMMLKWLCEIPWGFRFVPMEFSAKFMGTFPKSIVGLQYFTLIEVKSNARNAVPPMALSCWMSRLRVDRLSCKCVQTQFNILFGWLDQLFFNMARRWSKVTPFLAYLAKLGRTWITTQVSLKKSIPNKWWTTPPPPYFLQRKLHMA